MFIKLNDSLVNTDHLILASPIKRDPSFGKPIYAIRYRLKDKYTITEIFKHDQGARDERLLQISKILIPCTHNTGPR